MMRRTLWKPAEDSKLKEHVALYGPKNWKLIAEKLQGRTDHSCMLRWFNQLDPRINKTAFTEEEEERLMAAHGAYGNKWAMIARLLFPGRTDNAVKNRWRFIMRRRKLSKDAVIQTKLEEEKNGNFDNCRETAITGGRDLFLILGSKNQTPFDLFSDYRSQAQEEGLINRNSTTRVWNVVVHEETTTSNYIASAAADQIQNTVGSHFEILTTSTTSPSSPPFIDFLGVGAQN